MGIRRKGEDRSPQRSIRVAMGQIRVDGGDPGANMARAVSAITEAAARECDIIVLPECLDVGWTHPNTLAQAEPVPGPRVDALMEAAVSNAMYVVAGLTERDGLQVYNTAVLCSPEGNLLLKHRKINILTIAQDLYEIGDSLSVAATALGVIGIPICADNFPANLEIGHSLARMGAQILLSPCSWAEDGRYAREPKPSGGPPEFWTPAYAHLAKTHRMPVVGVSNVGFIAAGVWSGRACVGSSIAVDGNGVIRAQAEYGVDAEQMLIAELMVSARERRGTAIGRVLTPL